MNTRFESSLDLYPETLDLFYRDLYSETLDLFYHYSVCQHGCSFPYSYIIHSGCDCLILGLQLYLRY